MAMAAMLSSFFEISFQRILYSRGVLDRRLFHFSRVGKSIPVVSVILPDIHQYILQLSASIYAHMIAEIELDIQNSSQNSDQSSEISLSMNSLSHCLSSRFCHSFRIVFDLLVDQDGGDVEKDDSSLVESYVFDFDIPIATTLSISARAESARAESTKTLSTRAEKRRRDQNAILHPNSHPLPILTVDPHSSLNSMGMEMLEAELQAALLRLNRLDEILPMRSQREFTHHASCTSNHPKEEKIGIGLDGS